MKNFAYFYSLLVYLVCFIPCFISIFELDFKFNTVFFFIYSSIGIVSIYFYFKNKYIYYVLNYLTITNLIQSFGIVIVDFAYRFLLGPSISFSIYDTGDLFTKFSFSFFSIILDLKLIEGDGSYFFNFNLINILLTIYFFNRLVQYKKQSKKKVIESK